MRKAQIIEIFQSIQGEGKYVGTKQVFVRFYKCNMHCVWCDTPNSIGDGPKPGKFNEYTPDELYREVEPLLAGCGSISLTGGEPLLHSSFIADFIPLLKKEDFQVHLETNGILPDALSEVIDQIDVVAMDIKLPSSTKEKSYWQEHQDFLKIAQKKDVFVKIVISSDTSVDDLQKASELVQTVDPDILFILQPNYFQMKNGAMNKCLAFADLSSKYLTNVRVLPQTHKFMKLR